MGLGRELGEDADSSATTDSLLKAQTDADADELPEKPQPKVIIGHSYVRWVRNRVAAGRPVPSFGFELTSVVERCATAEDLLYLRRAVVTLALRGRPP